MHSRQECPTATDTRHSEAAVVDGSDVVGNETKQAKATVGGQLLGRIAGLASPAEPQFEIASRMCVPTQSESKALHSHSPDHALNEGCPSVSLLVRKSCSSADPETFRHVHLPVDTQSRVFDPETKQGSCTVTGLGRTVPDRGRHTFEQVSNTISPQHSVPKFCAQDNDTVLWRLCMCSAGQHT